MWADIKNENVTDKSLTEENALRAVNPTMTMVRIDVPVAEGSDDYLPLGVFTSFAAHGSAVPLGSIRTHRSIAAGRGVTSSSKPMRTSSKSARMGS